MPDGQPDQARFDSNSPVLWHQIPPCSGSK